MKTYFALVLIGFSLLLVPKGTSALACDAGSPVGSACRVYLTSGSSWTVPADWNSTSNTIEVIGGGGGGSSSPSGFGGGGGAYGKVSNITLTPGTSLAYHIGSGGVAATAGGDTYFCNSNSNCSSISGAAVIAGAKGGGGGSTPSVSTYASNGGTTRPAILAFDPVGNLYVSLTPYNTVVKDPAGSNTAFVSGIPDPVGLAFDSSGNLYISNNVNTVSLN